MASAEETKKNVTYTDVTRAFESGAHEPVAEGRFGSVHKIKINGSIYALKVIKKEVVNPKESEHINGELHLLERIKHPMMLSATLTFQDEIAWYILTPYYKNGDLLEFINSIPQQLVQSKKVEEVAGFVAFQLILQIYYLHTNGVFHADIKAENILIDDDGFLVLCDFGLSEMMGKSGISSTEKGDFLHNHKHGTENYISIDIIKSIASQALVTYDSDYYALANILYMIIYKKEAQMVKDMRIHFDYTKYLADQKFNGIHSLLAHIYKKHNATTRYSYSYPSTQEGYNPHRVMATDLLMQLGKYLRFKRYKKADTTLSQYKYIRESKQPINDILDEIDGYHNDEIGLSKLSNTDRKKRMHELYKKLWKGKISRNLSGQLRTFQNVSHKPNK